MWTVSRIRHIDIGRQSPVPGSNARVLQGMLLWEVPRALRAVTPQRGVPTRLIKSGTDEYAGVRK
jgi:hypothetical protein